MIVLLDNAAVLQNDYSVRAAYRCKTVGDDEGRSSFQQARERALNLELGVTIDAGGCLVEHQNLRIGDKGTRKTDQLTLPEREINSALVELRLVSGFEAHDELMGTDSLRCCDHVVEGGVRLW